MSAIPKGSVAGVMPNKVDLKSIGWNLLMVEGAAATTFILGALPGLDFHLGVAQTIALAIVMPAIFTALKYLNKWFVDNQTPIG